jgi:acyl carrier protein
VPGHPGYHRLDIAATCAKIRNRRPNGLSISFFLLSGATMSSPNANIDAFEPRVRAVLAQHARLSGDATTMDAQADLYQAGMTSHASVNVMLALEGEFDVEFPDDMLNRSAFASIRAICQAVASIGAKA